MSESKRILCVDDEPMNLDILEYTLKPEYHTLMASSGEEAIEMAARLQPDLILLDIMMPGLDGYETCRQLRDIPILRHTKIVLVSARAQIEDRLRGYEVGADDYLTKPFDDEELLAKIRVYMRLKSAEEQEQLRGDILSLLSHETRTPLNSIIPAARLLVEDEELTEEDKKKFAGWILDGAERLNALLDKSMRLCEYRSNYTYKNPTSVDLLEVIRRLVRRNEHIRFEPDESQSSIPLSGSESELEWALEAVLDNALRFDPDGEATIQLSPSEDSVVVQVLDKGPGIEPTLLPHIFQGFVPRNVIHHEAGHYLSLALCSEILRAHGGGIEIGSNEGGGTVVSLWVPLRQAPKSAPGEPRSARGDDPPPQSSRPRPLT